MRKILIVAVVVLGLSVAIAAGIKLFKPWGGRSGSNSGLGDICKSGDCVSVEVAAERGDVEAQFAVGMAHMTGKGLAKDDAKAVRWFRLAAKQGHLHAQFFLGRAYEKGIGGLAPDEAQAVSWFAKAAAQGQPGALATLGALHYEGRGVKQDYAEAERLWRLAAEQGEPSSLFNLGRLYFEGRGVPKNDNEALKWISAAAGRGHPGAPATLKEMGFVWPDDRARISERLAAATDLVKPRPSLNPKMVAWRGEQRRKALEVARNGADTMDSDGHSALYYAASAGDIALVEGLLAKGADPNRRGKDSVWSPLHATASNGEAGIAKLLIARGARIDTSGTNLPTPIEIAVGNDQNEIVELLLTAGADVNARDSFGGSLLHRAAVSSDNRELVELLAKAGANVNAPGEGGKTPLHVAASSTEQRRIPPPLGKSSAPPFARKIEIVQALLKAGADPLAKDAAGKTPADYATSAAEQESKTADRFKEIVNTLRASAANR